MSNKKKGSAKKPLREFRDTTNFNTKEKPIAERNRESYGFAKMGPFLRALALGIPLRARLVIPAINKDAADSLKSAFSCFNQTLNIIHANSGLLSRKEMRILIDRYFAVGEHVAMARQELYGNMDRETIKRFALSLLTSSELTELADKKLAEEELADELGVSDMEAEYDL